MKKDNSTFLLKCRLRREAMEGLRDPIIMETHGGYGALYEAVYSPIAEGLVIDLDKDKCAALAGQRPSWRVYNGDAETLIRAGLADDAPFNLIDIDPYGNALSIIGAYFELERRGGDEIRLVVNDGLRKKTGLGGAWNVGELKPFVEEYGNDLFPIYSDIAKEFVRRNAAKRGYHLAAWKSYYCGTGKGMTHYYAKLIR